MAPRTAASRPLRALLLGVAAVACALHCLSLAFTSLLAGQQHGAKMVARGMPISGLRGSTVYRRQAAGTVEAGLVLKKGGRIQVEYERVWYDCDILEVSDDGSTITARYDDGGDEEPEIDVATRVRPIPPPMPLTKGQKVEVLYEGVWYACDVLAVSDDGATCTAKYEDGGDEEADIDVRQRVREPRILLDSLEIGSKHTGTVISVAPFGAFVDIGAERDGLVHISMISQGRVDDVNDYVSVGQEVDVWVAKVDDGKLGLTMVEGKLGGGGGGGRPQVDVEPFRDYSPDQWIKGTVRGTPAFGIFVTVPSPDGSFEADGLVHITQIRDGFVESTADEVEIGQEVNVRVVRVGDGKIGLSMKEEGADGGRSREPREPVDLAPFEEVPEGTWLKGKVARIAPFGLFVTVTTPDGSKTGDGLVHVSQIRDGFVESAEDEAEVGQEVDVWIQSVDVMAGKMSLSMKSGDGGSDEY